MAARDVFHEAVKHALQRDGWTITDDPLILRLGTIDLYIDLGAEKLLGAEKAGLQIAVEVKSFLGASVVSEFHTALGQFLNYRFALQQHPPHRTLFLAVPRDIYTSFFSLPLAQGVVAEHNVKLLIYRPETQEVWQWIP